MTNLLIISITAAFLVSCGQNQQSQNSDNNVSVVMDTLGNAVSEKNMKSQLKDYLIAYNTGDPDRALYYIYPDIFEYFKQQYPDEQINMQEIKDSFFIEPIKKIKKIVKEKKIEYALEVGEITKKVNYNESKLYVVITYINAKNGLNKHSIRGEVVAISNDNGENWKFVENEPEFIQDILKIKFPQYIIDKLLTKE
jgi:hypothetical protein